MEIGIKIKELRVNIINERINKMIIFFIIKSPNIR